MNDIVISHSILLQNVLQEDFLIKNYLNSQIIYPLVDSRSLNEIQTSLFKQILGHDPIDPYQVFIVNKLGNLYIDIMQSSGMTGVSRPYFIMNDYVYFLK